VWYYQLYSSRTNKKNNQITKVSDNGWTDEINVSSGSDFTNKPNVTCWNIRFNDDNFGYVTNEEEKKKKKLFVLLIKFNVSLSL